MTASVRFWRAIRANLPETEAGDRLWLRLRHEPPQARKRHMPWAVDLDADEEATVRALMTNPPNTYLAFIVRHNATDPLVKTRAWS